MARVPVIAPLLLLLLALAGGPASAQPDAGELRKRVEARFELLPIADGVVLTPRFRTTVKSVEVSEVRIAVDGTPVTGAELRDRLGDDAEVVLQLSYLAPQVRRAMAMGNQEAPPSKPAGGSPPAAAGSDSGANADERPRTSRSRRRDEVVRIGGSVTVPADESVRGDVVVVGGSATIDGEVDGEVVVVGGSARFGPQADVHGDITVVGGRLNRDPGAIFRGGVHEVGFGGVPWRGDWAGHESWRWNPLSGFLPLARFMGTLARMGLLMLLAAFVLLVAQAPVQRIASRAADEPGKSLVIGVLVEVLFVPVLVLTVVVLAISIIGIPLLLFVPFAIVAAMVVLLMGFTGVAFALGDVLQTRVEQLRGRPYLSTFVGIVTILAPLIVARLVGLTGLFLGGMGFIVGTLMVVGFVSEYMAWTMGLGAAILTRFARTPATATPAAPGGQWV